MIKPVASIGLLAVALSVGGAGGALAAGFEILAPHRAVYDLKLGEASERSGIVGMNGRIVYEVTGNECDGMSVRYRFVTRITTSDDVYSTDQQTSTYESPDGKEFTFLTKSFVNDQPESTVDGVATRSGLGVDVALEQPLTRKLALPPATFISTHLVSVIESAHKGEHFVNTDIFDGSEDADEVVASTTAIGDAKVYDAPIDDETGEAIGPLRNDMAWPVTISYFEKNVGAAGETLPQYEASFLLYGNGVSRKLVMRYPDYTLSGHLTALEMLESQPCAAAD